MYQRLNIEQWNRKDHFRFFSGFDLPYFDICCTVECTGAYREAKETGTSFFQLYLYYSLLAANEITPFRYRIKEQDVLVYQQVHASPTINRPDGSFGFAYIAFHPGQAAFLQAAAAEIERTQNSTGLVPAVSGENVIHYSAIPWIDFRAITHARHTPFKDIIPKISFGKITEENGRRRMPVSISVHHALMDAYHVSQYLEHFEALMNP